MSDRCDDKVFKKGHSICTLDACMYRAEEWVQSVARESGQRVDWHYSGGIANVLYIGDHAAVLAAVEKLRPELERETDKAADHRCRCGKRSKHHEGRVLQIFGAKAHGPYRAGDPLPDGVIGVDTH